MIFKQAGLQLIYTYRFLPEVQAVYTFSPPHPPTQMISFSAALKYAKKLHSYLVNSKKNIIQGQNRDFQSLFVYNPTAPTIVFLLLFGTNVTRTTLQNCSVPCMLYVQYNHSLFQ